jgi:hypothetical protein
MPHDSRQSSYEIGTHGHATAHHDETTGRRCELTGHRAEGIGSHQKRICTKNGAIAAAFRLARL